MITTLPKIAFESEKEDVCGFELIRLSELFNRDELPADHEPHTPHRIGFFAILVITQGMTDHQLDFKKYTLNSGDCLIISKEQIHAFGERKECDGFLILFTEEFVLQNIAQPIIYYISKLYDHTLTSSKIHCSVDSQRFAKDVLLELDQRDSDLKTEIIASQLSTFLLKLQRLRSNQSTNTYDHQYSIFSAFKSLVEKQYSTSRNAKQYASELAVSYKTLNEACKKFAHKTVKDFVDDYIMLEIKRYLVSTTLSIKEIAYQCGFEEPTNFVKYFKNREAITPSKFRSNLGL